jgi:uncharacterized protein
MYEKGYGVIRNDTEAARWFRQAAEQGEAHAQYDLGVLYEEGQGVKRDDTLALLWLDLAAMQGNGDAAERGGKLAKSMTHAQVATAEKLAHEWRPKAKQSK